MTTTQKTINPTWVLMMILTVFTGFLGIHRMVAGKWLTGFLYLFTGGLFTLGIIYDVACLLLERFEYQHAPLPMFLT